MSNGRGKALIVEDEPLTSIFLCEVLHALGFETESHDGAETALDSAQRGSFAFALVDVGLPQMTGDLLVQALRHIQPALPLILMTGYDSRPFESEFRTYKGIAVVEKPFDECTLLRILNELGIAV